LNEDIEAFQTAANDSSLSLEANYQKLERMLIGIEEKLWYSYRPAEKQGAIILRESEVDEEIKKETEKLYDIVSKKREAVTNLIKAKNIKFPQAAKKLSERQQVHRQAVLDESRLKDTNLERLFEYPGHGAEKPLAQIMLSEMKPIIDGFDLNARRNQDHFNLAKTMVAQVLQIAQSESNEEERIVNLVKAYLDAKHQVYLEVIKGMDNESLSSTTTFEELNEAVDEILEGDNYIQSRQVQNLLYGALANVIEKDEGFHIKNNDFQDYEGTLEKVRHQLLPEILERAQYKQAINQLNDATLKKTKKYAPHGDQRSLRQASINRVNALFGKLCKKEELDKDPKAELLKKYQILLGCLYQEADTTERQHRGTIEMGKYKVNLLFFKTDESTLVSYYENLISTNSLGVSEAEAKQAYADYQQQQALEQKPPTPTAKSSGQVP